MSMQELLVWVAAFVGFLVIFVCGMQFGLYLVFRAIFKREFSDNESRKVRKNSRKSEQ